MKTYFSICLLLLLGSGFSVASENETCVNFTGHWSGQCTNNESGTHYREMTIEQTGCESLLWDGDHFIIGQETIIIKTDNNGITINGRVHTEWTPDKSQINMKEKGTASHPSLPTPLDYEGHAWIRINDGKLALVALITSLGGQPMNTKEECLLDKAR